MKGNNRMYRNSEIDKIMSVSQIDGITVEHKQKQKNIVKFKSDTFEEFKQFCRQENYIYEMISTSPDYVLCNVKHSIILHFIKCMQSENEETIKMLCLLPKEILTNRAKGLPCDIDWVDRTALKLVMEAVRRYDEPIYIEERNKMIKCL